MRHVFVETNWVFAYAAPAHHKLLDALELVGLARDNQMKLHVPALCLTEARQAIVTKCQPRSEANAIRAFLARALAEQTISPEQDRVTREVLACFDQQVRAELRGLDTVIGSIRHLPGVEVFGLNDRMLDLAVSLSELNLSLKPFDQAVLAAVLTRSAELLREGERDLCFCELDADLQPWDRDGQPKKLLKDLYDLRRIWVYGDFKLNWPHCPDNWTADLSSEGLT